MVSKNLGVVPGEPRHRTRPARINNGTTTDELSSEESQSDNDDIEDHDKESEPDESSEEIEKNPPKRGKDITPQILTFSTCPILTFLHFLSCILSALIYLLDLNLF